MISIKDPSIFLRLLIQAHCLLVYQALILFFGSCGNQHAGKVVLEEEVLTKQALADSSPAHHQN